jgi:hypothetical protein
MQSKLYELPSPRLTRGEYWLMEIMAEHMIPADFLMRDNLEVLLNKQPHGLSQDELLATILELSRQGLVSFITRHDQTECQFSNTDQIRDALAEESRKGRSKTSLCLTSEGARVWEAFAAPEWDDFVHEGYEFDDSTGRVLVELICASRRQLQWYLGSSYPSLSPIDECRVWWSIIEPWQATYWKTLPKAHSVRFVGSDDRTEEPSLIPQFVVPRRWHRWD